MADNLDKILSVRGLCPENEEFNHEVEKLTEAIRVALNSRGKAKTFRSSVGITYEMYDGVMIGGFNIETYAHKGYHAEEVGIISALAQGYNGTDFRRMVEVFQDAGHDEIEVFPGCPLHCWGSLLEFTHPYLEIVVADAANGRVQYVTTLKEMFSGLRPPAQVYPSTKIKMLKPKMNIMPKLPLNKELEPFYQSDPDFRKLCDEVLKVKHEA